MSRRFLPSCVSLAMLVLTGTASAQVLRGPAPPDFSPPPLRPAAPATESGFYLRGDVAANANVIRGLRQDDLGRNGGSFINKSIGNTAGVAVGVGYRFTPNVRVDATWELRSTANLKATDNVRLVNGRGQRVADLYTHYDGNISSQVALVSAYYDFGNWNGFTPFVGASVGIARNKVSGLTTQSSSTINVYSNTAPYALTGTLNDATTGHAADRTRTNFAWGLTAGAGYAINDRLTLEMAYRYMDLGKNAASNIIDCVCGSQGQPLRVTRLTSHDVKLGMRWAFGETPRPVPQYPVVTKY
ncbi:MAG: outer membrane beta-barrel protein [Proteobacteria bacterium]|nr:outer membrane beta-barrel protein [Pseudomonadota bacterium]